MDKSSGSNSEEEETQDFDEEDYLSVYNVALGFYANERWKKAETHFRRLLASQYFQKCGFEGAKPEALPMKLQFNSLRYLGFILAKRGAYDECLDCLEKAIRIDKSDVTLYFKLAVYAAKIGRYHMARTALEESWGSST